MRRGILDKVAKSKDIYKSALIMIENSANNFAIGSTFRHIDLNTRMRHAHHHNFLRDSIERLANRDSEKKPENWAMLLLS